MCQSPVTRGPVAIKLGNLHRSGPAQQDSRTLRRVHTTHTMGKAIELENNNAGTDLENPKQPVFHFQAKLWPQLLFTLVATAGAFGIGSVIGWSSPAILSLREEGDIGVMSKSEESWIGSMSNAGAFFAGFFVGSIMSRLGRKWTVFLFQIPLLGGWILIIFANGLAMMLVGRLLTGLGGGAMTLILPVYISESVEDKVRGTMSTLVTLSLVVGILFSYVVGWIFTWKWLSVACGIVPIVACAILLMPDSPRSLLERGRKDEAYKALMWLRGASRPEYIEPEIKTIEKSIEESRAISVSLRDLFVPSVLKPLGVSMALMLFQQLGGINAVMFYSTGIFESAGSDLNPNISSIIIGGVQVAFCLVTTYLVDRLGRKPLLIFSDVGMAICLVALGVFFYLKEQNDGEVPNGLGWLPLVSLILYIVTYNLGFGPLPWVMLGELVPSHLKGLAGGIANSFNWGLAFVVTRTFADLSSALTAQGCYWLFSGICVVGAAFCLLIVPETKGKSLDEINKLFK